MHIVILFYNIGGYHAARLRAAHAVCNAQGWMFTAIHVTDQTAEHPWGNVEPEISFPLKTLLPAASTPATDRCPDSPIAAQLLRPCLDQLKPDVLAIPGWGFPVSRAALKWSQRHQIPAILMSESKWDDQPRTWWKEQLKSWLYVRNYNAALVGGKRHRDYLIKLGFPVEHIFFGYDVVDNDYFMRSADIARSNPSAAHQRQPDMPIKPYFLAVTRLIPRKNVIRLIEAYAHYRQIVGEEAAWDLVICGSGEEEARIYQIIYARSLRSCVHLPGFMTYQEIGDWYGLASAFIHPALQEQWGLVVNEACAAGLPILCSRTVGACELICERQNGFTFNPASQSDMTRALIDLHQLDSETWLRFGQTSRSLVAHYSPNSFSKGLLQAIQAALP